MTCGNYNLSDYELYRKYTNKYTVMIKKVDNGYEIKVGCKRFVKEDLKELLQDLKNYFENPEKVYKKYKIDC